MSKLEREARRDAKEYARAEMFYGEGAGTRRKLIQATVESKSLKSGNYAREFHRELQRQDMAEHAAKARSERRRKDALDMTTRNTKALVSGRYENVQSGILVVVVAGYFAHQLGLDKKAVEQAKKLQHRYIAWKYARKLKVVADDLGDNNY